LEEEALKRLIRFVTTYSCKLGFFEQVYMKYEYFAFLTMMKMINE